MSYLLDTCIISKLQRIKKFPDLVLQEWFEKYPRSLYYISVLTIAEIQAGIAKLNENDSEQRKKKGDIENWLVNELIPGFHGRIIDFDLKLALRWGAMVGAYKREGINIPVMDSLIAATALHHELIVVTENNTDFNLANVFTINPWKIEKH